MATQLHGHTKIKKTPAIIQIMLFCKSLLYRISVPIRFKQFYFLIKLTFTMKKKFLFSALLCSFILTATNANAQEVKYYFVKNFWTKTYLFGGQDFGCGGKKTTPDVNSWAFEPVPGETNTYYIKHNATGNYLHIQNGPLDYGKIKKSWWSAQWVLEPVKGSQPSTYRIKNRWKPTLYLNNEKVSKSNGIECTVSNPNFQSSYWVLDDGF